MYFGNVSVSNRTARAALFAAAVTLVPAGVRAQVVVSNSADSTLRDDGTKISPLGTTLRAGVTGSGASAQGLNALFVFALPALPTGQIVDTASFATTFAGAAVPGGINYNADLYGILSRRTAPDAFGAADFFRGQFDLDVDASDATLLQNNFVSLNAGLPAAGDTLSTSASGTAALAGYLNAQYAGGAQAGDFVLLRLSPDAVSQAGGGYDFVSSQPGAPFTSANRPTLTVRFAVAANVIPEPGTLALLIAPAVVALGGGIRRRRRAR